MSVSLNAVNIALILALSVAAIGTMTSHDVSNRAISQPEVIRPG